MKSVLRQARRLITIKGIEEKHNLKLSRQYLLELAAKGRWPKPIQLVPRGTLYFDEVEVEALIEERADDEAAA